MLNDTMQQSFEAHTRRRIFHAAQVAFMEPRPPDNALAAIALGSNLGDRAAHLAAAFALLDTIPNTRVLRRSSIFETEPVGPVPQGHFLNAAAVLETSLAPRQLLAHLQEIERSRGRDRAKEQRWGPRTLDLDILVYGPLNLKEPDLTIPHPRLHERLFVLDPLREIAPEFTVPGLEKTVEQLASDLRAKVVGLP